MMLVLNVLVVVWAVYTVGVVVVGCRCAHVPRHVSGDVGQFYLSLTCALSGSTFDANL
jgi:hypothetical protein